MHRSCCSLHSLCFRYPSTLLCDSRQKLPHANILTSGLLSNSHIDFDVRFLAKVPTHKYTSMWFPHKNTSIQIDRHLVPTQDGPVMRFSAKVTHMHISCGSHHQTKSAIMLSTRQIQTLHNIIKGNTYKMCYRIAEHVK